MKAVREDAARGSQAVQVRCINFGVVQPVNGAIGEIVGNDEEKIRSSRLLLGKRQNRCCIAGSNPGSH